MSIPEYDPILDRYAQEIAESEAALCTCDIICYSGSWQACICPLHADQCNAEDPAPAHSPAAFVPVWRRRQSLAKDLTGQVTG